MIKVMWIHINNKNVVEVGLQTIVTLTENNSEITTSMFGAFGACEMVLYALDHHKTDVLIAEWGCHAISNLCINNIHNRKQFSDSGASDKILSILYLHKYIKAIVIEGCITISTLSLNGCEICQMVVSVLIANLADADTVLQTCATLSCLSRINDNAMELTSAGVWDILIEVLITHTSDDQIILEAFNTICYLIQFWSPFHQTFKSEKSCTAVATALKVHVSNSNIAALGCKIIEIFASVSVANKHNIDTPMLFQGVLEAIRSNISEPLIMLNAFRATGTLAYLDNFLRYSNDAYGTKEVCILLVETLERHFRDHTVVEAVCAAMNNVSVTDEIRKRLGSVGACQCVLAALKTHRGVVNVEDLLCLLLANLSKTTSNRSILLSLNAPKIFFDLLHEPDLSESSQIQAKKVLEQLKSNTCSSPNISIPGIICK
jgi:hypothetical protein